MTPPFRRFLRNLPLVLAAGLSAPAIAWGQQPDAPLTLPRSDVAVIYRFDKTAMDNYHKWQMTYANGGARVRLDFFHWVEAKYPYMTLIYDRPANRLITIHPESKSYDEQPIGNLDNPGQFIRPGMTFSRGGTETVAFAQCTDWQVRTEGSDEVDTACVTDDGIVLRLSANKPNVSTMTAIAIHYGAPPDGIFQPPDEFKRVNK